MFRDDTTRPLVAETNPISEPDDRVTRTWVLLVCGLLVLLPTAWSVSGARTIPFTGVGVGGLVPPEVTVLSVLTKPGEVLQSDMPVLVVETPTGEELPYVSPVDNLKVAAVHIESEQTLRLEEPVLTVRDPYHRDEFGYRLLMTAVVWLISLPLSVFALMLLARGLDTDFSNIRVGIHRTVAFLGWAVACSMMLWFNRVPIVVIGDLGDVGILLWLGIVVVLLLIQLWVFSALFRLEWFETLIGTLAVLCLTSVVWKTVDVGTAWIQTSLVQNETAVSMNQHELRGIQEGPEDVL